MSYRLPARLKSMDLLAVDIGNTTVSLGLFADGNLRQTWSHGTKELLQASRSIEEKGAGCLIAISSVVPAASVFICQHLKAKGLSYMEVPAGSRTIITGAYESMGSDRLANAAAAWKHYGKGRPVFVLDAGTATTLTAVSGTGHFCGGLITLGLGQTIACLESQFAQLPEFDLKGHEFAHGLALDTGSSLAAGVVSAHLGIIEHWVKLARQELGAHAIAIGTGGWSSLLARHSKMLDLVDAGLTLKGIYLLAREAMGQGDQS